MKYFLFWYSTLTISQDFMAEARDHFDMMFILLSLTAAAELFFTAELEPGTLLE